MKFIKFALLGIFLSFIFSGVLLTANQFKEKKVLPIILNNIKLLHYAPKPINDDFSKNVYKTFINQIDPNKQFFTKEDIHYFKTYETLIDDELSNQSFEFYNVIIERFFQRIEDIKKFYPDILKTPFNFNTLDSIELNQDKLTYAENLKVLKKVWKKQLKYRTLITYFDIAAVTNNISTGNTKTHKKSNLKSEAFDPKIEEKARQKVEQNTKLLFNRLEQRKEKYLDQYLNVITSIFDPHTAYFPSEEKENFDISMTGKLEGIGAMLSEEDGYIKIISIVPGSAAFRKKEIEVGDIILKVAEGSADPIDIVSMPVDEAVKYIRGKKGTEVRLTIKKPDGRILVVSIIRDTVTLEETYAKSCVIINKSTNKSFGYILLPKFYRDFNNSYARNSTEDLEKEIEKLKKENISGIILDLRNNGGGSLRDAIDIAGLFIESGPIVQVKDKSNNISILEDINPSIAYNGPVIILINHLSASASEIVAAALQDYHRAIIIGTSTYGKGSVQTLIDLDSFITKHFTATESLGALKLTIQQFFRINGNAIQFKGVEPDILIPDTLLSMDIGEKKTPYALNFSTANMSQYIPYQTNVTINLTELKKQSNNRIMHSHYFKEIISYNNFLKEKQKHTIQPLNFKLAKIEQTKLRKRTSEIKELQKESQKLEIISDKTESNPSTPSDSRKEWFSQIRKDQYISESINILSDMINNN